jgi:hypothetical protein
VNGTATNTATDTNAITVAVGTGSAEEPAEERDAIQPGTNGITARWWKQGTATSADNSKPTWESVDVRNP